MALSGGCFCGALRYEIDQGEYLSVNCHCSMCRRTSAAAYVTWLVVPKEHFRLNSSEPASFASSDHGRRQFCPACGTPVTCVNTNHPEIVDVTVCSLDDPTAFPPSRSVYTDTRLAWTDPER
ncbi:MAG: GFA family protein [Proteobacteria bacterium]|nr:GFA family protein [Pseudomonadota bacterium]